MSGFPPNSSYPLAIDSDRTLYLVYNTTETIITEDNQPWAEEISIQPQDGDKEEIWADNGFATISGELLYYDDVEKNGNNRVVKLKRCARNLGGENTHYNAAGTDIRSFVIAEHHNQLVDAIENIEEFIGIINSTDPLSLDFRIRQISDQNDCIDDNNCPTVSFDFNIDNSDPCDGTTISYDISIQGNFNTFKLDFGDGNSTTSTQSSTHLYAPNSTIDPVISIGNNTCQLVITAVERSEVRQPVTPGEVTPLTIPIPEAPDLPIITIPNISVPPTDISIPPIVFPCIDLEPINISIGPISIGDINVPSMISIVSPNFPSIISITPISFPSVISIISPSFPTVISIIPPSFPSTISIIPPSFPSSISIIPPSFPTVISIIPPSFPSVISIIPPNIPTTISIIPPNIPTTISIIPPNIPSTITVNDSIPSLITVIDSIPSIIQLIGSIPSSIAVNWEPVPTISVDWGQAPTINVSVACSCACCSSTTPFTGPFLEDENLAMNAVEVDYDFAGIPSKIVLEVPEIPAIKLDIPTEISFNTDSLNFPSEITFKNVEEIPGEIMIVHTLPSTILIDSSTFPKTIALDASSLPKSISIVGMSIPTVISVESNIPSQIEVLGMPKSISIEGLPEFLPLRADPIELVYNGAPIEMVVKVDLQKVANDTGDTQQCFLITPCPH